MPKGRKFGAVVWGELKLTVTIPITTSSLEEALERVKFLDVRDFVKITGNYIDGDLRILGITSYFKHPR